MIKKIVFSAVAIISILSTSCKKVETNNQNITEQINAFPKESLNEFELSSLKIMREEEKLAHDVYVTLFAKYGKSIFENIGASENTHTDPVFTLLKKYGIEDPVKNNAVGVFQDTTLQKIYDLLVFEGSVSVLNAYKVGATIEDLDIYDLNQWMVNVDNQDLSFVYQNLNKGSRNHLRSFYAQVLSEGGTYTPKYISQTLFDSIVTTDKETGSW